jgi:hypothetical protein
MVNRVVASPAVDRIRRGGGRAPLSVGVDHSTVTDFARFRG